MVQSMIAANEGGYQQRNFWEGDTLDNTQPVFGIKKMNTCFARHGIPDQVVRDSGLQYTSHALGPFKANILAISNDTHQLHYIPLHHFTI